MGIKVYKGIGSIFTLQSSTYASLKRLINLLNRSGYVPLINQVGHYIVISTNNIKLHIQIISSNAPNSNYELSELNETTLMNFRIRIGTNYELWTQIQTYRTTN